MAHVFTIDGTSFSTEEEFYAEVSSVLIPNADWGHNLDAFHDILRGGFGTPDEGFVLVWRHSNLSRERLGYGETIKWLEKHILICHPTNVSQMQQRLDAARRGSGQTLFDKLVEIIRRHEDIELRLE